jgi:hypothetical protein
MKNEAANDIGFILFISRLTGLFIHHYKHEWMKNEATTFLPFRFEMNATILVSLLMRMNEDRSYKRHVFQIFASRWRRISFYHYKLEWMKNEGKRFYPFRFEMNTTILLSLLTRMNEERNFKLSPFPFQNERDNPCITSNENEWRTKLQQFTIFVSRWMWLSFYHF